MGRLMETETSKEHTMRTWKCPECGHREKINYDWLAEHGGPVCEHCDCDMELQPEAAANEEDANERSATVELLVKKADDAGLEPEELDELVHELTASVAADVNNGGLEDQIACLVDGIGAEHTERQIDELIEERQQEEQ